MQERQYELKPRDVLFFRDGRPMDADKAMEEVRNIGHGAVWPRPDHLYKGVMHALLKETSGAGFGDFPALKVMGPYPVKKGKGSDSDVLYLPRPLDWDMDIEPCADTDLPEPLKYGFIDRTEGKKKLPAWIAEGDFFRYLDREDHGLYYEDEKDASGNVRKDKNGNPIKTIKFPYSDGELFDVESRIGTTLDHSTGASKRVKGQHASGQYQGEYLRVKKNVAMWCSVDTGRMGADKGTAEAPETPRSFVMGGQGGIVTRLKTDVGLAEKFPSPKIEAAGEVLVRWTLISPALFQCTGWLPGWCKDSSSDVVEDDRKALGMVMLPGCEGCSLVGACIGKAIHFSGWDTAKGIKPTVLAVPQGSVYLFKCRDGHSAQALVARLHLQRQSDFGPQGFGIGVCSIVKPDLAAVDQVHENVK